MTDRVAAAIAELADALREAVRSEVDARRDTPATLLGVPEAARLLSLSRTSVYGLLDRPGGIPTLKIGRRRLIGRADLDRFAARKDEAY